MKRLLTLLFALTFTLYPTPVYIIVPGTWALNETWHTCSGDFFEMLDEHTQGAVVTFFWNGKNNHYDRKRAACALANLIDSYPRTTPIYVVGHSHGTNVAILAAHLLADHHNSHHINRLYSLGTPIDMMSYAPNMQIIDSVYHFFSLDDRIQTVMGMFERTYPPHPRITNIRVVLNNVSPGHSDLHSPLLARWLATIPLLLKQHELVAMPCLVTLHTHQAPHCCADSDRDWLLEEDEWLTRAVVASTFRSTGTCQAWWHQDATEQNGLYQEQ